MPAGRAAAAMSDYGGLAPLSLRGIRRDVTGGFVPPNSCANSPEAVPDLDVVVLTAFPSPQRCFARGAPQPALVVSVDAIERDEADRNCASSPVWHHVLSDLDTMQDSASQ